MGKEKWNVLRCHQAHNSTKRRVGMEKKSTVKTVPKFVLLLCRRCGSKTRHEFWGISPERFWFRCVNPLGLSTCDILTDVLEDDISSVELPVS